MRSDARTRLYVFSVVPKNAMWQSPMSSLLNGRVLWPLRLSGCTSVANHSSLVCVGAGRGHTKLLRGGTTLVQVRGSICGIISRIELRPPPPSFSPAEAAVQRLTFLLSFQVWLTCLTSWFPMRKKFAPCTGKLTELWEVCTWRATGNGVDQTFENQTGRKV